ncbi:MAG: FAD:protein FMN transferase [Phycisphaerales bacterium]
MKLATTTLSDRYACLSFDAMGCRFEILLNPQDSPLDRADCQAVAEEIKELVLDWHWRLSVFESSSIVSRINSSPAGHPLLIDQDMLDLFMLCDQLRIKTRGAFNIASGSLMNAMGFRDPSKRVALPSSFDLNNAMEIDQVNRAIVKMHDQVSFDFGAIAKGYVLDLIAAELCEHGISNAFIHGGTSSILARGKNAAGHSWTSQLQNGYLLSMNNTASAISEPQSRTCQSPTSSSDARIGHIMDPRSGTSSTNTSTMIACIHKSAAHADAYTTACCVDTSIASELTDEQLSDENCSLLIFDSINPPVIYDPLGAVDCLLAKEPR